MDNMTWPSDAQNLNPNSSLLWSQDNATLPSVTSHRIQACEYTVSYIERGELQASLSETEELVKSLRATVASLKIDLTSRLSLEYA